MKFKLLLLLISVLLLSITKGVSAQQTCATIKSVSTNVTQAESGKVFQCLVEVDSAHAGSKNVSCGINFGDYNTGFPQNFCQSDITFCGWQGNKACFKCVIPDTNSLANKTVYLVGRDFQSQCSDTPRTNANTLELQLKKDPQATVTPSAPEDQFSQVRKLLEYFFGKYPIPDTTKSIQPTNSSTSSTTNSCASSGTPGSSGTAAGSSSIVDWATQISNNLEIGYVWSGYYNRLVNTPSNGNYKATYREGYNTGVGSNSIYWCTNIVIDSYNLAGFSGLGPGHQAVDTMVNYWKKAPNYTYVDYLSNPLEAVKQVQPGCAIFMDASPGRGSNGDEHTAVVNGISIDANGNGSMTSLDANSTVKVQPYAIYNGQVKNSYYPVEGFGCVAGGQNTDTTPTPPPKNSSNTTLTSIASKYPNATIAVYAKNILNGKMLSLNTSRVFYAASTSKVIVASAILNEVKKGNMKLTDTISGLTVEEHLQRMISLSDNNSWNVFRNNYRDLIDNYAHGWGLTSFDAFDNELTAGDMGSFMEKLADNQIIDGNEENLLYNWMANNKCTDSSVSYCNSLIQSATGSLTVRHKWGTKLKGEISETVVHDAAIVGDNIVLVIYTATNGMDPKVQVPIFKDMTQEVLQELE